MIKFHSEKQEEMMREVKEVTKEIHKFLGQTNQEISFVSETLRTYLKAANDFSRKVGSLHKTIVAKIEDVILNKEEKLQHERKYLYNSILTYSFKTFEQSFVTLLQTFNRDFLTPIEQMESAVKEYTKNDLANLVNENSRLSNEVTILEKERLSFRKKKEEFFDYFNQFDFGEVVRIKSRTDLRTKGTLTRIRQTLFFGTKILQKVLPAQPKHHHPEPDPIRHHAGLRTGGPPEIRHFVS